MRKENPKRKKKRLEKIYNESQSRYGICIDQLPRTSQKVVNTN